MSRTTNGVEALLKSSNSIVEQVLGIIDSKFQFTKYQTNKLIKTHLQKKSIDVSNCDDNYDYLSKIEKGVGHDATIFQYIESYSKTTHLLLFLRNLLNTANAKIIFELLSDDIYLNFSQKELKIIVEGKRKKSY